jgi:hypothetical protein
VHEVLFAWQLKALPDPEQVTQLPLHAAGCAAQLPLEQVSQLPVQRLLRSVQVP